MKRDRLIDLCMSSEGQTRGTKRNAQSARVGQALAALAVGGGSHRSAGEAWPPDGGRRVLNQTETNGV